MLSKHEVNLASNMLIILKHFLQHYLFLVNTPFL